MDDSLQQTIAHATTGDASAIEALLVEFLPGLRNFLAHHAGGLVGQKETPDDLAQSVCREVLERLAEHRLAYQGPGQFRQWLHQAALHKLQNRRRFYRADCRDAAREVAVGSNPSTPFEAGFANGSTPSAGAMRAEDLACLDQALAALTEPQRDIIRLLRFEGRSHAEVAQRLGITESHSRVLLARTMARLGRLAQLAAGG